MNRYNRYYRQQSAMQNRARAIALAAQAERPYHPRLAFALLSAVMVALSILLSVS